MEQKFHEYFSTGHIKGTVHTCIGQEACAVGFIDQVDKDIDIIFTSHRGHGHYIAYGGPPAGLISEIMGKRSGICRGLGGTQNLHWKNLYSSGIQGGYLPICTGMAFAEKKKQSGACVIAFIGDGTTGTGALFECFNIASKKELPIIFVVENNQYAQTTPVERVHAGSIKNRASPWEIRTYNADGNILEDVISISKEVFSYVRKNLKPAYVVLETYRLGPHSKGDDFRDHLEIERKKLHDPLKLLEDKISSHEIKKIINKIEFEVNIIFQECLKGEDSNFNDLFE